MVCLVPFYELKSANGNGGVAPSNVQQNPVLIDFINKADDRESLYNTIIKEITNTGGQYRLDKCCETINIILNKEDLKNDYFNINDLNALIDTLLREAQTNSSSDTRAQVIRLIDTIIQNKVYMEYKEKISEIK